MRVKKYCENCQKHLTSNVRFMGIKLNGFPRYHYLCGECRGSLPLKGNQVLLDAFQKERPKAQLTLAMFE